MRKKGGPDVIPRYCIYINIYICICIYLYIYIGVISERTHFVFRSRSARIIWLVQISSEMWEYDQNGLVSQLTFHTLLSYTSRILFCQCCCLFL
jgi:hypothetical protein